MSGLLLERAFSDIRRNLGSYLLTTLVVTLSVLIFAFFSLLYWNLHRFVERFGSELGIVVYVKKDIPDSQVPILYERLSTMAGVKAVRFVSSEDAFKRLRGYLKGEEGVLDGVDPTFLPPSFEVELNRAIFNIPRIRALSREIAKWPEVAKVQYGQEWIRRLEAFSYAVKNVVLISGLLLVLTAGFVVANTIKLNVYARGEELEILRLVGATNSFIEGPFLLEAFIQGVLGSGLALSFLFLASRYLRAWVASSQLLRGFEFAYLPLPFVGATVGASVLLCVLGVWLSMRRFLRL